MSLLTITEAPRNIVRSCGHLETWCLICETLIIYENMHNLRPSVGLLYITSTCDICRLNDGIVWVTCKSAIGIWKVYIQLQICWHFQLFGIKNSYDEGGTEFTHWPLRDVEVILQMYFSNPFYELISWALPKLYVIHTVWKQQYSWWRHQMETFFALLALCSGNFLNIMSKERILRQWATNFKPGPSQCIKMLSNQYMNFHSQLSYLYNGNSFTPKRQSLYWNSAPDHLVAAILFNFISHFNFSKNLCRQQMTVNRATNLNCSYGRELIN